MTFSIKSASVSSDRNDHFLISDGRVGNFTVQFTVSFEGDDWILYRQWDDVQSYCANYFDSHFTESGVFDCDHAHLDLEMPAEQFAQLDREANAMFKQLSAAEAECFAE